MDAAMPATIGRQSGALAVPQAGLRKDAATAEAVNCGRVAFTIIALFRGHPHISNVLTHVAGGDWRKAERAIAAILDPAARAGALPALERNLVRLLRAGRGTTGRLLKPYFEELAERALGPDEAERLLVHLDRLLLDLDGAT